MNKEQLKKGIHKCLNVLHNRWCGNNKKKSNGGGNVLKVDSTSRLSNCRIYFSGNNGKVIIDGNCKLSNLSIFLENDGSSIHISEGVVVNALPLSRTCFNAIEGKHIEIGSNALFSNGIELHTSDYHSVVMKDDTTKRINPAGDIIIGSHVWIGLRTIILKGTTIADNSVVGACSLVSKQFNTPNTLIAGIPAKEIKNNINWNKNKI